MTSSRKYANLPDLDTAPDIFETPELTDDASTRHTTATQDSRARSSSPDEPSGDAYGIDRHRLRPDQARSHFLSSRVDAREANFSDRIDNQRRSYRVSNHTTRPDDEDEQESSDEGEPSIERIRRRIARLHREAEELKSELDRRQAEGADQDDSDEDVGQEATTQLNDSLQTLNSIISTGQKSASARLSQKLSMTATLPPETSQTDRTLPTPAENTVTITYAPPSTTSLALAKAASFDTRLTQLESLLGLDAVPLPTLSAQSPLPILPTLDILSQQLTTLTSTSGASLETISKRIRQLTQDAEKLTAARRAAKESQEALSSTSDVFPVSARVPRAPDSASGEDSKQHDPEQAAKINALYGLLPTIESLAPVLPGVLDRLRSLRLLHAEAAGASQALAEVESRQVEMEEEIAEWREALEEVERKVELSEGTAKGNVRVMEGWIGELEGRVRKLGL